MSTESSKPMRGSRALERRNSGIGANRLDSSGLPKLPGQKAWPAPAARSRTSSLGSSMRGSFPTANPDGTLVSHRSSASSSRLSRNGGMLQKQAQADARATQLEFQLLAVEIEETDRLLASNLEKQNNLVARRWQRKVALLESESEPSLEAWLWNGGRWTPGSPLPAPRWPSLSPTRVLPDLSIRCGSPASRATPQRSHSTVSLARTPDGGRSPDSQKPEELLSWCKGIMDPQQQPAALYHRPLAPLALTGRAMREVRSRQRWLEEDEAEYVIPEHEASAEINDAAKARSEEASSDRPSAESRRPSLESRNKEFVQEHDNLTRSHSSTDPSRDARARKQGDEHGSQKTRNPRYCEVNRDKALQAFKRLGPHGEIACANLVQVLNYTGHTNVGLETVERIVNDKFNGQSHLDSEDFLEFIGHYEEDFRAYIQELFAKTDKNDSGSLSPAEISAMLRHIGITPTPGVVEELILEVTGVDHGMSEVSLEQFVKIHDIIRDRAGFTGSEVAQIEALFNRYDRNGSGTIDGRELRAALSWWGFTVHTEVTESFINEFVFDDSDSADPHSFRQIMRKHREQELEKIYGAFGEGDRDHNGTIDKQELPAVFSKLGYTTGSPSVIKECFDDCGLDPNSPLIFEDLYLLLEEFRHTEGFQRHELKEIEEVFKQRADGDGSSIGGISLASAIRWLGYPQTFEQVQQILETFEIDDNGCLDYAEFLKMLHRYRELEIEKIHYVFQEDRYSEQGQLSVDTLKMVLYSLGYTPGVKEVADLWEKHGSPTSVTFWELDSIVANFRREARERFRSNCGFTDREVNKLRMRFDRFDTSLSGYIENKKLAKLLAELFPGEEFDLKSNARTREILQSVDENNDGKLEFQEFLSLMRFVQDRRDADMLRKEQEAVKACSFQRAEVAEFRKVFQMFDMDASGEMSYKEFTDMIQQVVPLESTTDTQELQTLLRKVDEDGDRSLQFPEFLMIMRKIQEQNWHGINDVKAH